MANARSTVFTAGMAEGRQQIKGAVVDFLREKLVDDKEVRPDRGSPEYEYAMGLTRELMEFIEGVELK